MGCDNLAPCCTGGEQMGEEGQNGARGDGSDEGSCSEAKTAQEWYAQQLMSPEWMVDIPPRLQTDWYAKVPFPRPALHRERFSCNLLAQS